MLKKNPDVFKNTNSQGWINEFYTIIMSEKFTLWASRLGRICCVAGRSQ
jgi:hypothetical protein